MVHWLVAFTIFKLFPVIERDIVHLLCCESFAILLTQKRNLRFRREFTRLPLVSADLGLVRRDSCSRVRSHSPATGAAFYSIAFTPLDCFCVTGRPLRRTSVKETACEAIITQLRPDKARHSTPQPCQSVRLDTGRRANAHKTAYVSDRKKKKKKGVALRKYIPFPATQHFLPFLFPVSGRRPVKTLVAEF